MTRSRDSLPMACLGLALAAPGCGRSPEAATTPAAPAAAVSRGDFGRELLLTGELEAVRSIAVKAPETSVFQMRIQFLAEEGSQVKQGDPLLDFDNAAVAAKATDLETRILDAETQLLAKRSELESALRDLEIELAEKEFARDDARLLGAVPQELVSRRLWGDRQLVLAKAEREVEETTERIALTRGRGQAEVDVLVIERDKLRQDALSARHDLSLLSIQAPAAGLVVYERRPGSDLRFREGDSCWPGQAVLRLPDLAEMQVNFAVAEVDAPHLAVGMTLKVSLDAFPGRELEGRIVHVPSMAVKRGEESKISVFKVLASLGETWVGQMKPGMSARGRVTIEQRHDVPLVAREAVVVDGSGYRWLAPAPRPAQEIHPIGRNGRFYLLSEEEYVRLGGGRTAGGAAPGGGGA